MAENIYSPYASAFQSALFDAAVRAQDPRPTRGQLEAARIALSCPSAPDDVLDEAHGVLRRALDHGVKE